MPGFNKQEAEKVLGITIKDEKLFQTAFTHRSYLNEHPDYKNSSNERLEFLGDAVLQQLSSEHLFRKYPENPEGDLTNFRSALVNTKSLGKEARRLGYGNLLLLSNGEEASGGRDREYILANTFEAVLGALYIETDLEFCRKFVEKELFYKMDKILDKKLYKDAKSTFQELAQEKFGVTPQYKVLDSWGADHNKTFKVAVYVDGVERGVGEGGSKQKAEQEAALKALDNLEWLW